MKIGYPCINLSLRCSSSKTVRIQNFTEAKLFELICANLECLENILTFNKENSILFFRISSGLIPYGSHKIASSIPWEEKFGKRLESIGKYIKENNMRINMHPGQYTVLNSLSENVRENAVRDISYHVRLLDLLDLDSTNKVQIHVGGLYGNRKDSLKRFIENYRKLSPNIKKRLVIENDDRLFSTDDCLYISKKTGVPVVFDTLHQIINNSGDNFYESMFKAFATWKKEDGLPIIDFSLQKKGGRIGAHSNDIDEKYFRLFLKKSELYDFDIMLELKDKEKVAIKATKLINSL